MPGGPCENRRFPRPAARACETRMKSPCLFLLLTMASLSACARTPDDAPAAPGAATAAAATPAGDTDEDSPRARAEEAIRTINPRVEIDRVADSAMPGFQEVVVGGQVLYVSDDGRYVLQGALFDVERRVDMSQATMAAVRRELLAGVPASDRIVFAPKDPKYTVAVFTDVECGYCRRLHGEIAEYNRLGIAIEYLAFPRMGPASEGFQHMVDVWCATDRRDALTRAKNDQPVPAAPPGCTSPVAMQYDIGLRAGLTGTPMIITADGTQMPGYMPPDALRAALDKQAAEAAGSP
jgi:thiol:disulfide interchange protein DsbC